jgi:hypothetical protein
VQVLPHFKYKCNTEVVAQQKFEKMLKKTLINKIFNISIMDATKIMPLQHFECTKKEKKKN